VYTKVGVNPFGNNILVPKATGPAPVRGRCSLNAGLTQDRRSPGKKSQTDSPLSPSAQPVLLNCQKSCRNFRSSRQREYNPLRIS